MPHIQVELSLITLSSLLLCLILSNPTQAVPMHFTARYSGSQEVPGNASPGFGTGLITLDGNHAHLQDYLWRSDSQRHRCAYSLLCGPVVLNAGVAVGFVSTGFPLGVTSGTT